eukprot:jgi/Bigna1/75537/fgenesh1_pg.35_\
MWYQVCWQGGVNVRESPDGNSQIVYALDVGEVFYSIYTAGEWVKHPYGWIIRKVHSTPLLQVLPTVITPMGAGGLVKPNFSQGEKEGLMCEVRLSFATVYVTSENLRGQMITTWAECLQRETTGPLEIGTQVAVSSPYGEGCLVLRREDGFCLVQYEYGKAYIQANLLSGDQGEGQRKEHIQCLFDILDGKVELPSLWSIVSDREYRRMMCEPFEEEVDLFGEDKQQTFEGDQNAGDGNDNDPAERYPDFSSQRSRYRSQASRFIT